MGAIREKPIVVVDTQHAFGYHRVDNFPIKNDPTFQKFIWLHNGCNFGSIFLSPLAGLVRLVTAAYIYFTFNNTEQSETNIEVESVKRFALMQAVRGALELLCLGVIMGTVVDGIMTLKHNEMLCFKA